METLGRDMQLGLLRQLDLQSVLSLGASNKDWVQLVGGEEALWRHLAHRDQPTLHAHHADILRSGGGWAEAYRSAHRMQSLRRLVWEAQEQPGGRPPRGREGHAACSWGRRSMLISGGFGGGVISDLHHLTPQSAAAGGGYRWVQPQVAGRYPVYRYGHSLTRCGSTGQYAVVYGGMMAGGYQAPLDTIAVLRRVPAAPEACSEERREEQTSLGLSLGQHGGMGRGQGGAWSHVLWAQMLRDYEGEGSEDEEDAADSDEEPSESDGEEWYVEGGSSASSEDAEHQENAMLIEDELPQAGDEEEQEQEGLDDSDDDSELIADVEMNEGSLAELPRLPASAGGRGDDEAGPSSVPRASLRTSPGGSNGSGSGSGNTGGCGAGSKAGAGAVGDQQGQEQKEGQEQELDQEEEECVAEAKYEWWYPEVGGEPPGARGYHSAAVSEDGLKIWFFGGLAERGACNSLTMLDVATWQFSRPLTSGDPPSPRLGHSSCVYGGKLWVVGGGSGRDLLRSGQDLADVHCLDLETLEWRRVPISGMPPRCAGKCHTSAQVGSRLLLFAGSMHTCNEVAWLDLEALAWGRPEALLGTPPCERMSATAVLAGGGEVLVYGGYGFHSRELGDLHRLKLLPNRSELAAMEREGRGSAAGRGGAAGKLFARLRGFL